MSRLALWLFGPTKREMLFGITDMVATKDEQHARQMKSLEEQNQILERWMREKIKQWDARIEALETARRGTRRQQGGPVPPPPVDRTLTAAGDLSGEHIALAIEELAILAEEEEE